MQTIHIQQWDEQQFYNAREQWQTLLDNSSADPLFLSWEWQSNWWRIFSEAETMQLRLMTASDNSGKLIGIAPLYITTVITKKLIKTSRLQFIGNCWRGKATMPTELLSFITDKAQTEKVTLALLKHISKSKEWHELILPSLNTQCETYQLLSTHNSFKKYYLREAEKYNSYFLNTQGLFSDYTSKLGKNTRLKLLNRRSLLEKQGKITFQRMLSENIDELFSTLNNLHEKRWGKSIFNKQRLQFNLSVAKQLAEKNCLNFSLILLNNKPISVQYNYVIKKHNYNIQAGFDEGLHKKISLGYLHFGYEIEATFNQKDGIYDFLAGEGKNTQYKERLTDTSLQMIDLQVIRKPSLKLLYKLFDLIK